MSCNYDLRLTDIFNMSVRKHFTELSFKNKNDNFVIYDPGLYHTSICKSSISSIDKETGDLFYRGINVLEKLELDYSNVAFEIIFGSNDDKQNFNQFSEKIHEFYFLYPEVEKVLKELPITIHPIDFVATALIVISSLKKTYSRNDKFSEAAFIIAQLSVAATYYISRYNGTKWELPDKNLTFSHKILSAIKLNSCDYNQQLALAKIFNSILILHAEHGQNCSSATVRNIASSKGSIYNAITSGMFAFNGSLHGGASEYVSEMYAYVVENNIDINDYIDQRIERKEPIYGFGQRTYNRIPNCWDPRVKYMYEILNSLHLDFPQINEYRKIALLMIERSTNDDFFIKRNLTPNPDLFNCIFYKLFGVPHKMNTLMISLGRVAGWLANFYEHNNDNIPLTRPCDLYN